MRAMDASDEQQIGGDDMRVPASFMRRRERNDIGVPEGRKARDSGKTFFFGWTLAKTNHGRTTRWR